MHNPFTIGSMIQNPAEFVGRTAELQFLLTRLRSLQSCSVVGERRIGKSSLLYHLHQTGAARLGDTSYRFVYVELADAAAQTVVDFLRTVLDALQCPTDAIRDDNKPSRNLTAFDQAIKARTEAGERLVLCLDEFEALFENPSEFNDMFFNHLRTMVSHRRLALVTASRQPLEIYSLERKLTSPFYNVLSVTTLGDFTEEEAVQFVALHHSHVNFTDKELRFINSWLDPHPLKLQILCDQVLQNRERQWREDVLVEEVRKMYRQFLGDTGVRKTWNQFKGSITLKSISDAWVLFKAARELFIGGTPSTEKDRPVLFISQIELADIRCFEQVVIDLSSNNQTQSWGVILGDNGIGKTTLLRCIALGLASRSDAVVLFNKLSNLGLWIRKGSEQRFGRIKLTFNTGDFTELIIGSDSYGEKISRHEASRDSIWKDIFACGYGAARASLGDESHSSYSMPEAVASLFDYNAQLQNIELAIRRLVGEKQAVKNDILKQIDRLLMLDSGSTKLKQNGLEISGHWGGSISLAGLGDGYRTTLSWVLDMLSWAVLRNADAIQGEIQGIVLIDEIEQHLHPRWQRYILKLLHQQFPKVQLVSTTHSPLCVTGASDFHDDEICLVHLEQVADKAEASYSFSLPRGKRADQVLTSYLFGLETTTDDETKTQIGRLSKLLSKNRRSSKEDDEIQMLREILDKKLMSGESKREEVAAKLLQETLIANLENRIKELVEPSGYKETLSLEAKRQLKALLEG